MPLTHDALSRRFRFAKPKSTGRFVAPTDRDFLWFDTLHRHGPLPTAYLLEYSRLMGKADNRARDRLTHLYNEANTPHRGTYLERPWQQRLSLNLGADTIHDLSPRALQALKDANRLQRFAPPHAVGIQWKHDVMLSCFTSSIELATLREADRFTYIFHDEICERMGAQLRFKLDDGRWLKPDRAFGIRYKEDDSVRLFLVEADRGTEQNKAHVGRKTAIDNLQQYREFITGKRYQEPMKWKAGLMLINIMTSPGKMANVQQHWSELTGGGANYMLFKSLSGFTDEFKPPPPMLDLFTEPWERTGRPPFYLNQK